MFPITETIPLTATHIIWWLFINAWDSIDKFIWFHHHYHHNWYYGPFSLSLSFEWLYAIVFYPLPSVPSFLTPGLLKSFFTSVIHLILCLPFLLLTPKLLLFFISILLTCHRDNVLLILFSEITENTILIGMNVQRKTIDFWKVHNSR